MTDNGSPADVNDASAQADEFPIKLRVHALARKLGITSREVLGHLAEIGHGARSPQSSIDREIAYTVRDRVTGEPADTDVPQESGDDAAPKAPEPDDAGAPTADSDSAEVATTPGPAIAQPEPTESAAVGSGAAAQLSIDSLFSAAATATQESVVGPPPTEAATVPLFLSPDVVEPVKVPARKAIVDDTPLSSDALDDADTDAENESDLDGADDDQADESGSGKPRRRRRGRRGRGRGRGDQADAGERSDDDESAADVRASESNGDSPEPGDDEDSADEGTAEASDEEESPRRQRRRRRAARVESADDESADGDEAERGDSAGVVDDESDSSGDAESTDDGEDSDGDDAGGESGTSRRRRRRRRRKGTEGDEVAPDDPPNTVVHEREPRTKRARDEVQGISGSTRLEAKRQRRRDGRDAGRRRPPILSESEFLARREAVDRVMVVRERAFHDPNAEDYTQVAVLEDGVLVEHFVTTETSSSLVGNIYLGRVQNVLPGMEAAFVDIGRGRNGVLYAGEVNWDAAGLDGGSRKIEQALKPGDSVLVQVSKDPVGHKGARLTTQISLAGRYLVYVPGGSSTGISRKLPDVERKRLKQILAKLLPEDAGVIIRTASEGVSADELGADIARLESQWKGIEAAVGEAKGRSGGGPRPLYEEPDLLVRVVRDLFNEDFKKLIVEGDKAWNLVERYVSSVAPDLMERVERFTKRHADAPDSFVVHRIDEQLAKALDRKVWLPSGGTLIIEHTEAMTVVDVNTGKFTGSGGNLEETVTRNNLEAAEEIVRQMRLRDLGGMIIVDFIDMVLESNRDLVLRRLTEALARDRTRHQVSEVTSLGLVQMTRKRLGTGLLEAFSTTCTACAGRGIIVHQNPVEVRTDDQSRPESGSKRSRKAKKRAEQAEAAKPAHSPSEHPMFRAMAAHSHEPGQADCSGDEALDTMPVDDASSADGMVAAALVAEDIEIVVTTDGADVDSGADAPIADAPITDVPAATVDEAVITTGGAQAPESAVSDDAPAEDGEIRAAEPATTGESGARGQDTAEPGDDAGNDRQAAGQDTVAPEPARASGTGSRRRRVVRVSSPTTTTEPVVMTSAPVTGDGDSAPVTTSGPSTAAPAAKTVAVRRRPRRRSAGRPAGPPVEE